MSSTDGQKQKFVPEPVPQPTTDGSDPLKWPVVKVRDCPKGKCPVEISYNTFGDKADPCVLLVMGHNTSGVVWASDYCEEIASHGFFVIRFDNRDCGLSTKFDHMKCPPMWHLLMPDYVFGWSKAAPYQLIDMVDDACGLLDALGIKQAHWVGESMGGMLVQTAAIHRSERVLSMVSLSSTTGNQSLPDPSLKVKLNFLKAPKSNGLEDMLTHRKAFFDNVLLVGLKKDEKMTEQVDYNLRMAMTRTTYEAGATRQMFAIRNAPNRDTDLSRLQMPTLVLHGKHDVLIPVAHGQHTANAIRRGRENEVERHPDVKWIETLSHGAGAWAHQECLSHIIPFLKSVPSLPPAKELSPVSAAVEPSKSSWWSWGSKK